MIGGTRYDLELVVEFEKMIDTEVRMQMVFTSFLFSINSPTALFCTKECVANIDAYFEKMQWDKTNNPNVDGVPWADMAMYFDTDNRFSYVGSGTLPDCNGPNVRDVCMTIYPIQQKHVDLFRNKQLSRNEDTKFDVETGPGFSYNEDTKKGGNFRVQFPKIDAHRLFIITNEYSAMTLILIVVMVVFIIMCLICTICCCCYCCKHKKLKAQA